MRVRTIVASSIVALYLFGVIAETSADAQVPLPASTVGYEVNTFHSVFHGDIDLKDLRTPGYNWYLAKWFGWHPTKASSILFNGDGSITLTSGEGGANYTIGSAAETGRAQKEWVGTAFGGGGYFEAELKFDPRKVGTPGTVGFPAWWLEPLEHSTSSKTHWSGQPAGYEHYVEVDIFEYNPRKEAPANDYFGSVHEWYGISGITCPREFCQATNYNNQSKFTNYLIATPSNNNFLQFHKFGVLWVPATKTSQGYLQYYFDGHATGDRISWSQYRDQPPPPTKSTPWTFGILDRQHMYLILGTGDNEPMTVQSVNVWQASDSQNLHQ